MTEKRQNNFTALCRFQGCCCYSAFFVRFPCIFLIAAKAYDNVPLEILNRMMIFFKGHFNKIFKGQHTFKHANDERLKIKMCIYIELGRTNSYSHQTICRYK